MIKQHATFDAPAHLRPNTKAWWQSVHRDYDLGEHNCPFAVDIDQIDGKAERRD